MVLSWITYAAILFITWWITLFTILPVGLRTQEEDQNVAPGTEPSAPSGSHLPRAMIWTTVIALMIVAGFYYAIEIAGLGLDDFPHFIPGA